ncbi:hypothetical protein A6A20_06895 [Volucribacter amazonae]|uniref:Threonine/homoserine/homoserine lactone efflux protein n=2 Tax=Volucribacter amazonae TaxID=256731 RepID=A0A9X4PBZ4_9PAST|nr:hypothetical protein [Volucribacter amazonae]
MDYVFLLIYTLAILLFLSTSAPVRLVFSVRVKYGVWAGLKTIMGAIVGALMLIILSFILMRLVFAISEWGFTVLTLLSSGYLLYFSLIVLKDKVDGQGQIAQVSHGYFRGGLMISIAYLKNIVFFMGFLLLLLEIAWGFPLFLVIWLLLLLMLNGLILLLYAVAFSACPYPKRVNILNGVSGVVLLVLMLYTLFHRILWLFRYFYH